MYVIDADQRRSRTSADVVPEAMARVHGVVYAQGEDTGLPFERTAGDEFQGLLTEANAVIAVVRELFRMGGWSVGIGAGAAELPLPDSVRSARGEAFLRARAAVEAAKSLRPEVEFLAADRARAAEVATLLRVLAGIWQGRSEAGWEAVDAMSTDRDGDLTVSEAAGRIGITRQALSQRLQAAQWKTEKELLPLLKRLMEEADRQSSAADDSASP